MAIDWEEASLGDLYEFTSGLSKPKSAFGSGYPFVTFNDVFHNTFLPDRLAALVESTAEERRRLSVMRGDVFLTRTSETVGELGMSCVALSDVPNATFNGFTKRLRPRSPIRVVPEYAGYYFRSPKFRRDVTSMSWMSTRASLNNEMLAKLSILVPPVANQCGIARVLKPLDDKAELNRRMNDTLEAMARAVFKSWFLDFDPVRAKAEGRDPHLPKRIADVFPESVEQTKNGEIPTGWKNAVVGEFVTLNPEVWTKGTRPSALKYIDLSNTKWGRIEAIAAYSAEDAPSRAQRVLRPGDTIVGTVRPGNGSFALISQEGLTGSTGFAVLRPTRPEYTEFIYLACTSRDNIERLAHLADGAAYPAVRPEIVADTQMVRSSSAVMTIFSNVTSAFFNKISANNLEVRSLTEIHDTLLPKLISGEIRVKDAEKIVSAAA